MQEAGAEVGAGKSTSPAADTDPSARTDGRTVTVPVPEDAKDATGRGARERGWQFAHWAVANASALHIERVSYAGREWTAGNTDSRWRATRTADAAGAGQSAGAGAGSVRIVTAR